MEWGKNENIDSMEKTARRAVVQFAGKVGLSAIPLVGPIAIVGLGEYLSYRNSVRVQQLTDHINERLDGHEDRLNKEFIRREEFYDLFMEVMGE
jgi:hypothetical protein